MKNINFVIFSGGTGGHVIPAVNFGNYLIEQGYSCSLFLDKRGLKYFAEYNCSFTLHCTVLFITLSGIKTAKELDILKFKPRVVLDKLLLTDID